MGIPWSATTSGSQPGDGQRVRPAPERRHRGIEPSVELRIHRQHARAAGATGPCQRRFQVLGDRQTTAARPAGRRPTRLASVTEDNDERRSGELPDRDHLSGAISVVGRFRQGSPARAAHRPSDVARSAARKRPVARARSSMRRTVRSNSSGNASTGHATLSKYGPPTSGGEKPTRHISRSTTMPISLPKSEGQTSNGSRSATELIRRSSARKLVIGMPLMQKATQLGSGHSEPPTRRRLERPGDERPPSVGQLNDG
jgi:hypothetical protein